MSVTIIVDSERNSNYKSKCIKKDSTYGTMTQNFTFFGVVIWIYLRLVDFIFIPVYIIRMFKIKRKCSPINNELLFLPASQLVDQIVKKKLTSETVVKMYIERIKEVNPTINAIIDERFENAIKEAKDVDYVVSSNKYTSLELKEKYPLLGIPLTVKGSLDVSGLTNTSGLKIRRNIPPSKSDAEAVRKLRYAGAIPILTSNVPELCLNWETTNKLKGTTKNPYDTRKTVGGSSGGECALLGSAASLIGIGSDIAGSLRVPAHFCGVWGHKPTPGAVSYKGHYPNCPNKEAWEEGFTVGPLSRYASDLKLLLEIMIEPEKVNILDLRSKVDVTQLKIYYLEEISNQLVDKPNANVKNAIQKVIEHFNTIGKINCTKLNMPMMNYAGPLACFKLLDIDDIDNLFDNKGNGSIVELIKYLTGCSQSEFTSVGYGLLRKFKFVYKKHIKVSKLKLEELKQDLNDLLKDDGVLICPTYPSEANFHGDILRKLFNPSYCTPFNGLGFPVTNCPVSITVDGLPVGIQVVAAPNFDRLSLAVAQEIERTFGGWQPPTK